MQEKRRKSLKENQMDRSTFELQDDLRKFYAREERMREIRTRILNIAVWVLAGLGAIWLCWLAFR